METRDPDSFREFDEAPTSQFIRRDLRPEVAQSLRGIQGLPTESLDNHPSLASAVHELLRLQNQAVVLDALSCRLPQTRDVSEDIGMMRPVDRESGYQVLQEHRSYDRNIGQ